MNCDDVRQVLALGARAGELDAAESEVLQLHLDNCAACRRLASAQRALDEVLGQAMHDVPVSEQSRERLLSRLREFQRRRVVRAASVVAVATVACIGLLAVGWFVHFGRPVVTSDLLQAWGAEVGEAAEIALNPATAADAVEQRFRDMGVAMEAPRSLNYALLRSFQLSTCLERQVPKLVFARGEGEQLALADVYVLSEEQFDLTELSRELATKDLRYPSSGFTLEVHPSSPGSILVAIVHGGSFEQFKSGPQLVE